MRMRPLLWLLASALLLSWPPLALAGEKGVIHDADGYTNIRAKPSTQSAIVGRVTEGQVFEFDHQGTSAATWVTVKLASGGVGYMHASRVCFYSTMDELTGTSPEDEINVYGRGHGMDYYPLARAAARGEEQAMQRYFGIDDTDGAAAETHYSCYRIVVHLLGDARFARFLRLQTPAYLANVREHFLSEVTLWPFVPAEYVKRHFPATAKVLSTP